MPYGIIKLDTLVYTSGGLDASTSVSGLVGGSFNNISASGTVSGASFIPTGSSVPTNGLYLPSSNNVAISTNSLQRLAIDASGNINIDSGGVYYDAVNNRLAVGTTSPGTTLHLNATNPGIRLEDSDASGTPFAEIFGSSGNLILQADAGDEISSSSIQLLVDGNEAARIDSSRRLLVGTSSASGGNLLQVNSDASINGLTVGRGAGSNSASVAIGLNALATNSSGYSNCAIGGSALNKNTSGIENTAVGQNAGAEITTGSYNTCIGRRAGNHIGGEITSGTRNVIVGAYSRPSSATATDQIVLGTEITGQADSNVTIGSSSGKIYNAYTVNATWTQTSDQRLKRNIQNDTLGLSFIKRLRPVTFQWKPSYDIDPSLPYYREDNVRDTETVIHGLLAQEVKTALDREGVSTFAGWDEGEDGIQAISREMFVSPLIKAIQELSAQVDDLKAQLAAIKAQ